MMPTRPSAPAPPESGLPFLAPGPILPSDMRALYMVLNMERAIGRLEKAVENLENANARHEKDLNQLGKIAHAAKTLGNIALSLASGIGIAILVYLYHHFSPLLFSK